MFFLSLVSNVLCNDYRKALRDHMDAAKLPCIPHLGKSNIIVLY